MKKINIRFAVVSMLMLGMMLTASCGKDKPEEPSTDPENPTSGGAWPERRISQINYTEIFPEGPTCFFTWHEGKVTEITSVKGNDTIRYIFTYSGDKVVNTHYYSGLKEADFVYDYNGGVIDKVVISTPEMDGEHNPYLLVQHDSEGNVTEIRGCKWDYSPDTIIFGIPVDGGWSLIEDVIVGTYSYSNGNIISMSYHRNPYNTTTITMEYDNHPSPVCMPLGIIEALSFPLNDMEPMGEYQVVEDLIFGNVLGDGMLYVNYLWNKNNVTKCKKNNKEQSYRYDYDASGLYPTTMYIVQNGTDYPMLTFTYEN
ncbi:MAG: hypothetical protein IKM79_01620 [Bacteroidales bacterium]|nr:hypothetical protein [Bacteroidales bacterium]